MTGQRAWEEVAMEKVVCLLFLCLLTASSIMSLNHSIVTRAEMITLN